MPRHVVRLALLLCLAAWILPAARAEAQGQITFTAASAVWHDALDNVPGVQPGDPVITNGVPTSSISWGTTAGPQSGYDVTITIPDPQMFPVAVFAHRNFPVSDPSLTSVQLDFVLDFLVNGVQTGPLTFTTLLPMATSALLSMAAPLAFSVVCQAPMLSYASSAKPGGFTTSR